MTRNYDASRQSLYHPGTATDFFQGRMSASEAILCAEMARLAYVKEPERLESYLARAGFHLQNTFGYGGRGTQVFIATTSVAGQETVVMAFRGTEVDDFDDALADGNCLMVQWQSGRVHQGFAAALQANGVLDALRGYVASKPQARLLLTGHSLGAALATLAASVIPPAGLYTFGSPRVGDQAFADSLRNVVHERYVDCCDLVTNVPLPVPLLHYVHSGHLRYIDRNGQVLDQPSTKLMLRDCMRATLDYWLRYALLPGNVWVRRLADHAPVNYLTALVNTAA
jgi:hypothetical protein